MIAQKARQCLVPYFFFLFFSTLAQWDLCSRFSGPFWRLSCVFCFLNCWDISSVSCLLHSLRSDPPSAPQSAEGRREEEASASQSLPRAAFFFLSSRGTTKTNKSNSHFCKSSGNSFFQSSHSLIIYPIVQIYSFNHLSSPLYCSLMNALPQLFNLYLYS